MRQVDLRRGEPTSRSPLLSPARAAHASRPVGHPPLLDRNRGRAGVPLRTEGDMATDRNLETEILKLCQGDVRFFFFSPRRASIATPHRPGRAAPRSLPPRGAEQKSACAAPALAWGDGASAHPLGPVARQSQRSGEPDGTERMAPPACCVCVGPFALGRLPFLCPPVRSAPRHHWLPPAVPRTSPSPRSPPSTPSLLPQGISGTDLEARLPRVSAEERVKAINALLSADRLVPLTDSAGGVHFRASTSADRQRSSRLKGLTTDERFVYQLVEQASTMGIWTRDIKRRSNLPQNRINKILKTLDERRLIKSVKAVSNASRKMYMLYDLEPAREVTGGPWYEAERFDGTFADAVGQAACKFIRERGSASVLEVSEFIKHEQITTEELTLEDISNLLGALEYDGHLEWTPDVDARKRPKATGGRYTLAPSRIPVSTALSGAPCGVCPVIGECFEGGKVSPSSCAYFQAWLEDY